MQFQTVFIIIFILFLMYLFCENTINDLKYQTSSIDGKEYLVRDKEDSHEAADLLAVISKKMVKLCHHLKEKYQNREDIDRLFKKFNPNVIVEAEKGNPNTSYSINKGEKIVLCLRSKDDEERLVDENTLTFVSLHELAHIMTKSIGHESDFWENFAFILKHAINIGIYNYENYSLNPKQYCGIPINSTPLVNK